MHHGAKLRQNRLKRGWDMAILQFFKMAATAILDFQNFKFLTVGTVKRVELHPLAKFRQNRANRGWDITIFRFFQDGGRPPSWICNAWVVTTHQGHLVFFVTVQNLVGIDAAVLKICVFRFRAFGLKAPIHAPKLGVFRGKIGKGWGDIDPPTNSFLLLGVYTSVSNLVKIDEEMRPWECPETNTHTHTHGQTQNDFIICPMLYAIAMGQIIMQAKCK